MKTVLRLLGTLGLLAYNAAMPALARAADEVKACPSIKPPPDAKLISSPPMHFLLSPATTAATFSGCQYLWIKDGTLLVARRYERGSVVRADGFEPSAPPVSCRYGPKAVVAAGPKAKCEELSGALF